ncbi:hypothetical protein BC835DRAFT_1306935 [Cytidiella melzeri]|nr:hypothetical protein BC835DRAFT_1306935 [Cytidiella melzeri]
MSLKALFYAYVLGGLTFIPLLILAAFFYTIYTSVPVGDPNFDKLAKANLEQKSQDEEQENEKVEATSLSELNDQPKPRKGWLTVRRTFEELPSDGGYVGLVKGFLDARSKDPKRSRPKDMWYVVLKAKVLYLYEDESMTECEAVIELGGHDVLIYPEDLPDGELFAKRNAICLKPKLFKELPSLTKEMLPVPDYVGNALEKGGSEKQKQKEKVKAQEAEKKLEDAKQEALDPSTPWFIFVKSNVEMEDWYLSLIHASDNPPNSSTLSPLYPVFRPADMLHLVETLDSQPDVIPMRWLNALLGRIFFSYYRTHRLEAYIIRRLMHKLSKIKRPTFLTDLSVREVSVGDKAPTLSKPMLKELTKEGDASLEVHLHYKGEIRIIVGATATINLGSRFKPYEVKVVLAAVLREIEGNLLIKVKRPPSSRIWYAFTQVPKMVLDVEPIVSERQITWSMILSNIESRLREVILESVVLPNMDDISFFDSFEYGHRGGIWQDASRREGSSELYPSASSGVPADEAPTPASAPALDIPSSLGNEPELVTMERSSSAPAESLVEDESAKDPLVPTGLPRAQTVSGLSATSVTAPRRRTWFSGVAQGDESTVTETGTEETSEAVLRGRPTESLRQVSTSGTAVPQQSDSVSHGLLPEEASDSGAKRSVSQHSQASSRASQSSTTPPPSEPGSSVGQPDSLFAGFRSKSPASSTQRNSSAANPTNNFFQTLKSRDKQAISNTAKEAIKKWGVSWGSLRKDNNSPSVNTDDASSDGEAQRETEDQVHKPKPSYADVRAAVAQRRGTSGSVSLLRPDYIPSDPVTISEAQGKQRSVSISSSTNSQHDNPSPSSSLQLDHLVTDRVPRSRSISPGPSVLSPPQLPPRKQSMSHQSQTGSENLVTPPSEEDGQPARVIQAQPSAPKAMTIPGIHAKHKGEVMSMGYAPPPAPSEPKKQAALPSVYRLWKTPSNQTATSTESQPEIQAGFAGIDQDAPVSSIASGPPGSSSPLSTPGPALPPRPVPPPLPPRSTSTNAVLTTSIAPRHPPEANKTSPPASATLIDIVSRDSTKRSSVDMSKLSSSPALPTASHKSDAVVDGPTPSSAVNSQYVDTSPGQEAVPTPKPGPPALPPRRSQAAATQP